MGKYDDLLDAPGKYADLLDEVPIPRGKYADLIDADAEIQAATPSVNTGDYTISSAKAAPTNAVPILQPVDGQWTPEAIAAHNAGADELNPPTPAAIAERDYNAAAEPWLRMRMGDVRYTSAELDKMQTPRIEAREATPIADAWENVKRAVFVTEQQKYDESIPITQPDGSVKYEYKPYGSRLDRTGLMTPLLETKMMEPEADDSTLDATGKATFNFMAGLVNFGLSPLGIATVGLGAASGATARAAGFAPAGLGAEGTVAAQTAARLAATARVVSGGFAVDMASAVPEQYKAATESPTLQGKVEGWLGVVSSLGFAALAAKHAAKQPLNPVERQTVENVVELAKRAPDAVLETVALNREADTYSRNLAKAELMRRYTERQAAIAPETAAAAAAAEVAQPPSRVGSASPASPEYQYESKASQDWWEKQDALIAKRDAIQADESTIGSPERKSIRDELEAHGDLIYTEEGRALGLGKRRINKNNPLEKVNVTSSQYDTIGQADITGWKFDGEWKTNESGKQFRRVISPNGKDRGVVWKDTLHQLENAALEKNNINTSVAQPVLPSGTAGAPDPAATAAGVIKTAEAAAAAGRPFEPRIEEPGTPTPYGRGTDVYDITTGLQRKPLSPAPESTIIPEQKPSGAGALIPRSQEATALLEAVPKDISNFVGNHDGLREALGFTGSPLTRIEGNQFVVTIIPSTSGYGKGIEIVESKSKPGFPVVTGRWMDVWEPYMKKKYGVSKADYSKLSAESRAEIEAKNQRDQWLEGKRASAFADSYARTYHPKEWEQWMNENRRPSKQDPAFMEKPYGDAKTIKHWEDRFFSKSIQAEPTRTEPSPVATPAAAVPKLREGQKQGDLLGGSEDLTLVGERVKSEAAKPKGPEPTVQQTISDALDAYGDLPSAWEHLDNQVKALEGETKNKATVARLNAAKRKLENVMEDEARREEMSALETEQGKGYELLSSVKELGGLPTLSEKGRYATGELQRIAEASKGAFLRFFRKGAKSLDRMRKSLNERGFAFETPEQMLMAIEDSLATNKKQYGSQFPEGYTGGPGAMGPVEKAYQDASRKIFQSAQEPIQQRRVAEQRGDREEWLRRSDPDRMAEAEAIMEKNENAGRNLVDSINAGETKSATDIQELILVRELIDQHAKRDAAAERLADPDPTITRTEREQYQKDWNEANERISKTEDASDRTGSEKGAAFRMRRMMVADDYSLQGLSRRERKMKGRDLTPKEVEALRKESDSIKKAQEEVDRLVETEQKANEESAVDSVLAAAIADREAQKSEAQRTGVLPYHPKVLEQAERIVSKWEEEAVGAAERLKNFFGSESGSVGGVGGPKGSGRYLSGKSKKPGYSNRAEENSRINDLAVVIRAKIGRFSLDRTKTLETLLVQFGDGVRPYFDKAWKAAQKIIGAEVASKPTKVKEAIKTGATAPEKQPKPPKSKDTLVGEGRAAIEATGKLPHNVVAQIVDGMIDAGNRDRADIFKRTTKIVQEFMPEAEIRDVYRAYVDYGKKTYPNLDEAAAFKRKTRQAVKIEEDIARLKEKLRPELQGYQREKLDIELRDLVKQRSELLKDPTLPQEPGAFASKDDAKQTRIKNRIEELDRYLKTGKKPVEGKPTQPDSAKTEQLRAEKEALEAYVREVDAAKNPPLSDAQKALDAAMIARERAGQTLDDISTGKVKGPAKLKEALTQLEEDVRLETDALKALAAEMRRDAKPKGDPGYLKEQAQIKALERAIANYEKRVVNADFAAKGKVQGPDSQRVTQLKAIRDLRRAAYQAAKDAGKPVRSPEDRYNDTRLNAMKRREEDLKARATRQAAGDFSKKPKPVTPALRRDVLNKKAELQKMKDEIDLRQKEYELSQQPAWQKALRGLGEARGIILGGDLGVLTRQGAFAWSRPINATVGAIKATQAMFSPEAMGRWEVEMRERVIDGKPVAPIRKEAGLQTTDTMSHPEELVISRLLSRMPDIKIGGRTIKASVFFKGLERFQTTFINDVRMRTFDAAVKRGFTPEELKLRANFINSATGRSNAKMVGPLMSAIFTSPRYERSRWEMLTQPVRNVGRLAIDGYKGELNRAALANLQDMAVTAAGAVVLFQLAATAGYKVNWDPESTDFLKMRKGDEVWDVTAGLAPRIRDLMRIYVGFSHPDYKENWIKTGGKMIVRTINPALKTPAEQLSIAKQRYEGVEEPKSPFTGFKSEDEREGLITLAPLIYQSMKQAYDEDGLGAAAWAGGREFIGSSVSRYPEPEQ